MRMRASKIKGSIGFIQSMTLKLPFRRRIGAALLTRQICQFFTVLNGDFALVFQGN